jgi:uncharacterized protein
MYLQKMSVGDFIDKADSLYDSLADSYKTHFRMSTSPSEINSWKRSLPALAKSLSHSTSLNLRSATIYLEYQMPSSSCRADVLIVGSDADRKRSGVVLELKQWDCNQVHPSNDLVMVGGQEHLHPSEQALSYRDYMTDLSKAFATKGSSMRSLAFMHNCIASTAVDLRSNQFAKLTEVSPLYTGDETRKLLGLVDAQIVGSPDPFFEDDLDEEVAVVNKSLFQAVAKAIKLERSWTLLDEQLIAYHKIMDILNRNDGEKHLILVQGGPGTGKSAIAMQAMGDLCRKQIKTVHVTNSSSFTTVIKSLIMKKGDRMWSSAAVEALFKLSHNFIKLRDNFEVAICDEAHRFRKTTNMRPFLYSNRPQADELFEHVRVVVAFTDEKQILRRAEEGTVKYFTESALRSGVEPKNIHGPIELVAQFRCAGSKDFVDNLDRILYEGESQKFRHEAFETKVFSSPELLEQALKEKLDTGYSARLVAGFCWKWSDPNEDNTLAQDVKVGTWERAWNRKAEAKKYPPASHPYTLWANRSADQLSEVGCIYSVQGFEFDYIGVIWGPDLVWRNDRWIPTPSASCDSEMKSGRGVTAPEVADRLLKNAYRVLCSRGIRGCYIHATDKETLDHLAKSFMP